MGTAVPTFLPHFSLLYTGTSVGAAEAPAPLPHLSFIMRAAGSFNSARNPAPLPSLSSMLGSTSSYALPLDVGTYTITGGNVEADYQMAANLGTYAISGQAVSIRRSYTLAAVSGSYGINGQTVQLLRGIGVSLASGTYTIGGVDAQLVKSSAKTIFLATGTFMIAGSDLTFRRNYTLHCDSAHYDIASVGIIFSYVEVQHYIVPYLIGSLEDSARTMIEAIHGVANVVGSGGTVVSQSPAFESVVLKGQVVTITMGGPVNHSRRRRHRGLPRYGRGGSERCN